MKETKYIKLDKQNIWKDIRCGFCDEYIGGYYMTDSEILKEANKKGWIYDEEEVSIRCPKCQTSYEGK